MTPVSSRTGRAGRPVSVGRYSYPLAIALTPSGGTAVVLGSYAGTVSPISTRTRQEVARIKTGRYPVAVAIGE